MEYNLSGPQFVRLIEGICYELNIPKSQFYKSTGITAVNMSQWRSGFCSPTKKKLDAIMSGLQMSQSRFDQLVSLLLEKEKATEEPPDGNDGLSEFTSLFSALSPQAQQLVVEQMQGLLKLQEQSPAVHVKVTKK